MYTQEQIELRNHIDSVNDKSRKRMANEPGLWIGIVTNDLDHWAEYDIYNVDQYQS